MLSKAVKIFTSGVPGDNTYGIVRGRYMIASVMNRDGIRRKTCRLGIYFECRNDDSRAGMDVADRYYFLDLYAATIDLPFFMPVKSNTLPIHSLPGNASAVQVRRIEHKNPYDFTREHRHTYFEVFFFEKGGGSQLIDFVELPVREKSCYIVFPQQIHLLKRAPGACGRLVQFGEELITSTTLRMMLQRHFFNDNQAVFFEQDAARFSKFGILLGMLEETSDKTTAVSKETGWHYLQAMLLQLLDGKEPDQPGPASLSGDKKLLFAFQQILEGQFRENHQVARYANELATTERKLASLTQRFLGLSPLQVIHNRLLLEAKRLLLFEATSHKEIAFDLGFDSPASFSLFIKNKTGFSPSELNRQLVDFHKITEH